MRLYLRVTAVGLLRNSLLCVFCLDVSSWWRFCPLLHQEVRLGVHYTPNTRSVPRVNRQTDQQL